MHAKFSPRRDSYEVKVFGDGKNQPQKFPYLPQAEYKNVLTKDPGRIAQILLDLQALGFPIEKAVRIFLDKFSKHDWMGI